MKDKIILTSVFLFTGVILQAQVLFNNIYSKSSWDYADAVIEREDGNYLVAGSSRSQSATDYDVFVLLVDPDGNLIWNKYLGQGSRQEFGYSLIQTSDNKFLVSGRVGNSHPYLIKFDSTGSVLWDKQFTSSNNSAGYSIGESSTGNYFFLKYQPYNSSTLIYTNSQGDSLWSKTYENIESPSVIESSDSGFVFTGTTITSNGDRDIVLFKVNSNADSLWTKAFGGDGDDRAKSVIQTPDSGYLIIGNYDDQVPDGESPAYLIRTDLNGDSLWIKTHWLGNSHHVESCGNGNGFIMSSVRYHYFATYQTAELLLTKLDNAGDIEWSRSFEDRDIYSIGNNVTQTSDGGFLLTGHVDNGLSPSDIALIKLDSVGNFVLNIVPIPNQTSLYVDLYPNPATNELYIELGSTSVDLIRGLRLVNPLGQEISKLDNLDQRQIQLNVTNLQKGIYFYELTTSERKFLTGKFIKQ